MIRYFFYTLLRNILRSFWGRNVLRHILAAGITLLIVLSDFDWVYFKATRPFPTFFVSAVILGWLVPMALPAVLYAIGSIKKNLASICGAFLTAQAAIIGLFVSYFYKTFTGRPSPNSELISVDDSRKFRFGFMKAKGIFPGWPSSHTTVAFSIATAIWILYPDSKAARYFAFSYALFVGIGVSITAHWLSDVIAGAIIGAAVGKTVANSFKKSPCSAK